MSLARGFVSLAEALDLTKPTAQPSCPAYWQSLLNLNVSVFVRVSNRLAIGYYLGLMIIANPLVSSST
jgi:hypothetical protein